MLRVTGAAFDHLCGGVLGQHAGLFPLGFGLDEPEPLLRGPRFLEVELSAPAFLPKILKEEAALLLGSHSPAGVRHVHSC